MIFYDVNFRIYDDNSKNEKLNQQGEWIWKWIMPLTEEEEDNLSAGRKDIKMFYIYDEVFRNEIYQAKIEGKSFERKGDNDDIIIVFGTSSSLQAIIKNGQYSRKFNL